MNTHKLIGNLSKLSGIKASVVAGLKVGKIGYDMTSEPFIECGSEQEVSWTYGASDAEKLFMIDALARADIWMKPLPMRKMTSTEIIAAAQDFINHLKAMELKPDN